MQGANSAQVRRKSMTDMAIEEVNFTGSFAGRFDLQNSRRATYALERNEIPEVEIAECSAGITRARVGPRPQKRLHRRAKIRQLERLFDKLNCVRSVAFGGKLR